MSLEIDAEKAGLATSLGRVRANIYVIFLSHHLHNYNTSDL